MADDCYFQRHLSSNFPHSFDSIGSFVHTRHWSFYLKCLLRTDASTYNIMYTKNKYKENDETNSFELTLRSNFLKMDNQSAQLPLNILCTIFHSVESFVCLKIRNFLFLFSISSEREINFYRNVSC